MDECSSVGGPRGHHCTLDHGTCVNLEGGYTCACEEVVLDNMTGDTCNYCDTVQGYRMDRTNTTCLPVDTCTSGQHTCHHNATCLSTGPGTFTCACNSQYTGDGHLCEREFLFKYM